MIYMWRHRMIQFMGEKIQRSYSEADDRRAQKVANIRNWV
jgi:hypothetical protein